MDDEDQGSPKRRWESLADAWAEFDDTVMKPDTTEDTRRAIRQAFYSGAAGLLGVAFHRVERENALAALEVFARLQNTRVEIVTFLSDIEEGRA